MFKLGNSQKQDHSSFTGRIIKKKIRERILTKNLIVWSKPLRCQCGGFPSQTKVKFIA